MSFFTYGSLQLTVARELQSALSEIRCLMPGSADSKINRAGRQQCYQV